MATPQLVLAGSAKVWQSDWVSGVPSAQAAKKEIGEGFCDGPSYIPTHPRNVGSHKLLCRHAHRLGPKYHSQRLGPKCHLLGHIGRRVNSDQHQGECDRSG